MQVVIPLDAVEELLTALRVPDVLNANVHPLLDVAVADDLVNNNTDGVGGDVVNNTGPAEQRVLDSAMLVAHRILKCTYPW